MYFNNVSVNSMTYSVFRFVLSVDTMISNILPLNSYQSSMLNTSSSFSSTASTTISSTTENRTSTSSSSSIPSKTRPPLLISERIATPDLPPPHHVLSPAPGSTWSSYLPHWNPIPEKSKDQENVVRTGFCNPWPSAHKPTAWEVWENLEWGLEQDAENQSVSDGPTRSSQEEAESKSKEEEVLKVVKPDFGMERKDQVKATWLGHAGVLLQLPPIGSSGDDFERPVRVLFDPIFSER